MYPALLLASVATIGSVFNLTKISVRTHHSTAPKSLSERATLEEILLLRFRKTLFICSTLFALAIYGFIAPSVTNGWWVAGAWTITYLGIIAAAILPARDKTFYAHFWFAQGMGLGMLLLAVAFWKSYSGVGSALELAISLIMAVLAMLTYADKRRFIFYELGFLYLNHISIVVAASLLR
jgi:hypothetical protein